MERPTCSIGIDVRRRHAVALDALLLTATSCLAPALRNPHPPCYNLIYKKSTLPRIMVPKNLRP